MARRKGPRLFRLHVESRSYGRWLRVARGNKTQIRGCKEAGLDQRDWSRMERDGLVPNDELLGVICRVVGRDMSEALSAINADVNFSPQIANWQDQYALYKQAAIEREKKGGPVGIFVVRQDPEPVDYVAVAECIDLLAKTENTWLTLLFRHPDPRAWRSYHQLVNAIRQQMTDDPVAILRRLRAFYRHPECAEAESISLPLVHPYILTCDRQGTDLASYLFDEFLIQHAHSLGRDAAQAQQHGLCMVSHDKHQASQVAQWVGLSSFVDPLARLWVAVESQ